MPTCIICLELTKFGHSQSCLNGHECSTIMCIKCNEYISILLKTMCLDLPFIQIMWSANWTCSWDCLYEYLGLFNFRKFNNMSLLAKNKQINILLQIQLPSVLSQFLLKDITNIIIEYCLVDLTKQN